jgi:uncharacterized protein
MKNEKKNFESCLYACEVGHFRLSPKKHDFKYKIYMFYVDLDEIDLISKRLIFFSQERFNLFNFRKKDHLQLLEGHLNHFSTVKENITAYLVKNGITENEIGKIKLVTNVSVLGYNFNPVSFYYVFDRYNKIKCSVVEVQNTFHELKPYFIGEEHLYKNTFYARQTKYFYVSPFIDHDADFEFQLCVPNEILDIKINDILDGKIIFKSYLTGKKTKLNDINLVYFFFTMPFVTLKIIFAIHWQALRLWYKNINYFKKDEYKDLQRNVLKPHSSLSNANA